MNQTQENDKKPNWDPQFFFMDFTSAKRYTLMQAIILCNFKET